MSSSNARNIVELRQLLASRFPGVKMTAARETMANRWSTGLGQIDSLLHGGLPKRALSEVVSAGIASGTSLLLRALIERARNQGEWIALIDASDSFDPTNMESDSLSRLLWLRCKTAKEAIKSADMLLHDGTLSLVVLDLLFTPSAQLRRIPSSNWFRIQRVLEHTSTAFVVLTPEHMISNAVARIVLEKRFSLESLDHRRETLLAQIAPSIAEPANQRIVKIA